MNKQEIQQAISYLQSSVKKRSNKIDSWSYLTKYELENAHFNPDKKVAWRSYHDTKDYRNNLVQQQKIEKKMLKHFYNYLNTVNIIEKEIQDELS